MVLGSYWHLIGRRDGGLFAKSTKNSSGLKRYSSPNTSGMFNASSTSITVASPNVAQHMNSSTHTVPNYMKRNFIDDVDETANDLTLGMLSVWREMGLFAALMSGVIVFVVMKNTQIDQLFKGYISL